MLPNHLYHFLGAERIQHVNEFIQDHFTPHAPQTIGRLAKITEDIIPTVVDNYSGSYESGRFTWGYKPTKIQLRTKYCYEPRPDETCGKYWPIGSFAFDTSNCGVGSIHQIHNWRCKGLGVLSLSVLESIMRAAHRFFVTCTINTNQHIAGCGAFLTRNGYTQDRTFVGGNSGQTCYSFFKDFQKTPPVVFDPAILKASKAKLTGPDASQPLGVLTNA